MNLKKFEQKQSNYEPVKIYSCKENPNKEKSLDDLGINSFEKLDNFIEKKLREIEINKENTCKIKYNII
mgnify:CR=1 FL=1